MLKNKVLIITGLFPPASGPGAKRITQFVKYLVPLGWESIVLTHRYLFMGYDEKSLETIPNSTKIFRTFSLEPLVRKASSCSPRKGGRKLNYPVTGCLQRFVRLTKDLIGAPDTGMLWLPFAVLETFKIVGRGERFKIVFATGPAFSNFLIGLIIKWLFRKPLIVDFRDAWIENPEYRNDSKVKLFINKFYEKIVIRNARFAIANTEGVRKAFLRRYPKENPGKFVVIPNGFDREDLQQSEFSTVSLDKEKFNIVHTGSLGGPRSPKNFLVALKELIREESIDPNDVKLHLIGLLTTFEDGKTIDDYIEYLGLNDQVIKVGFVSRQEAMDYNRQADLLLLVIGVVPPKYLLTYGLSGKVYDYILSGKPIYAMAQKGGATYRLLSKYKIGVVADPSDIQDMKEKFLNLYRSWKNGHLIPNYTSKEIELFDIKNSSEKLMNLFECSLKKTNSFY